MRAWMLAPAMVLVTAAGPVQSAPAQRAAKPATGSAASGQTAPAAAQSAAKPNPGSLDDLLLRWSAKSRGIQDLQCEFDLESRAADPFQSTRVEHGKASVMKPYFFHVDLIDDETGKFSRSFIATGKAIHQYEFKTKQEIVHILPDQQPGQQKEKIMPGPLGFVFDMSASDVKNRFDLSLIKEDRDYAWVDVVPRTQADQQEFKFAKLIIDKKTYLPKQMLLTEPNGNQQRWTFNNIALNVKPTADTFNPWKNVPRDWKRITNQYGDPIEPTAPPKPKEPSPQRPQSEAGRPVPKR